MKGYGWTLVGDVLIGTTSPGRNRNPDNREWGLKESFGFWGLLQYEKFKFSVSGLESKM